MVVNCHHNTQLAENEGIFGQGHPMSLANGRNRGKKTTFSADFANSKLGSPPPAR